MSVVDSGAVRYGRVRGRYFRENFAQGGLDLTQVVPELVTNADAAIAASGRSRGRIVLRFGDVEREFVRLWRRELRRVHAPPPLDPRVPASCADHPHSTDA